MKIILLCGFVIFPANLTGINLKTQMVYTVSDQPLRLECSEADLRRDLDRAFDWPEIVGEKWTLRGGRAEKKQ